MSLNVSSIRTFALAGHFHSGKTSLAEAILFKSGATSRYGSVDTGQSVSDYTPEEKDRKMSIYSTPLRCEWKKHTFFILDTPGYADFYGEVVCALSASGFVILTVDATSGVDVGTHRVRQYLEKHSIPYGIFVTKLDKEHTDFTKTVTEIQESFGEKCVPVVLPIGKEAGFSGVANILKGQGVDKLDGDLKAKSEEYRSKLMDIAAESDDKLLEKYLGGEPLTETELFAGLEHRVCDLGFVPVFCGNPLTQAGVDVFMDELVEMFGHPGERGPKKSSDEKIVKVGKEDERMSAQVFKNVTDPYIGHVTYFRIYSGVLKSNCEFLNMTRKTKERIGHIYHIQGKEQISVESAGPGEIIAIPKLKGTLLSDTIGDGSEDFVFPAIDLPKPMVTFAVTAKNKGDEEKVGSALHKLAEEDPCVNVVRNAETKELVIAVMGELHLGVLSDKIKTKYATEAQFTVPKVAYKETIKIRGEGHEKHKKQSGGRGQYGEVYMRIEPKQRGEGYEFASAIVGGVIPRNFIPAIEKGVVDVLNNGVIAGCHVVDLKVTVYDGSYHDVDYSEIAFKIAGAKAFKDAFTKASPCLLEPIMSVETTVPQQYMGDITGLYNSKRGRIMGMESLGHLQTIKANVPIAEMFSFSNELRSLTGGRGSFVMDFSHYEEVPGQIAKKVIDDYQKTRQAEAEA